MKFKVEGHMTPVIANFLSGKYAIAGDSSKSVKVNEDTTLEDIEWIKPQLEKEIIPQEKEWKVKGSKGNFYKVTYGMRYKCNCIGFQFRKKCSHVEQIKERTVG